MPRLLTKKVGVRKHLVKPIYLLRQSLGKAVTSVVILDKSDDTYDFHRFCAIFYKTIRIFVEIVSDFYH